MWTTRQKKIHNGRIVRSSLYKNEFPLSFAEVFELWRNDEGFRHFYIQLLADCSYSAFRWETPAVTETTMYRPFEFAMIDTPSLERLADKKAFAEHFNSLTDKAVSFFNLGKDALMIAPAPVEPLNCCVHLGAFMRQAPEESLHCLWQLIGEEMLKRVVDKPIWLNTAGAGVAWLHVRLDSKPKYYNYRPYRQRF